MNEIVRVGGPLSEQEQVLLDSCERAIHDGLNSFVSLGKALFTIRHYELYRDQYENFEDYCQTRWRFNKTRASQLIGAAATWDDIKRSTSVDLQNERVVRELRRFPESLQPAIVQVAQRVAEEQQIEVTRSLIESTGTVLQEALATGGVDLGDGDSHPLTLAIATEETERILRRWEHVRAGSKWDRVLEDSARLLIDENGEIWMRVSGIREGQRVRVLAWRDEDASTGEN